MQKELLKRMDAWLTEGFALRAELEIAFKQGREEIDSVFEATRELMKSDDMTIKEAAAAIGVSVSSIYKKRAGTGCLSECRIQKGASISFPRAAVVRHRENQIERGECGDCQKAVRKQNFKVVNGNRN